MSAARAQRGACESRCAGQKAPPVGDPHDRRPGPLERLDQGPIAGVLGVVVAQVGNGHGVERSAVHPLVLPLDSVEPQQVGPDDRRVEHRTSLIDEQVVIGPRMDVNHRQPLDPGVERDPRRFPRRRMGGLVPRSVAGPPGLMGEDPGSAREARVFLVVCGVRAVGELVPDPQRQGGVGVSFLDPGPNLERAQRKAARSDLANAGGDRRQLDEQRWSDQAAEDLGRRGRVQPFAGSVGGAAREPAVRAGRPARRRGRGESG